MEQTRLEILEMGLLEECRGVLVKGVETKERSDQMRFVIFELLKLLWMRKLNDVWKIERCKEATSMVRDMRATSGA